MNDYPTQLMMKQHTLTSFTITYMCVYVYISTHTHVCVSHKQLSFLVLMPCVPFSMQKDASRASSSLTRGPLPSASAFSPSQSAPSPSSAPFQCWRAKWPLLWTASGSSQPQTGDIP